MKKLPVQANDAADNDAMSSQLQELQKSIKEFKEQKERIKKIDELNFLEDIAQFLKSREININGLEIETRYHTGGECEQFEESSLNAENECVLKDRIDNGDCYFVKICEINHDDKMPPREVFENVLGALTNPAYNFVYMISGRESGVEIFFGVVKNYKNFGDGRSGRDKTNITVSEYGKNVLEASLTGNFPGSRFRGKNDDLEKKSNNFLLESEMEEKIFKPIRNSKAVSLLTGIPSLNEKSGLEKNDYQGIDRLINTMMGSTWQFIVICEPVKYEETQELKQELYAIFDHLHLMSKISIQASTNTGNSIAASENKSHTRTKGTSAGGSESDSSGGSSSQHSTSKNWGDNKSVSDSEGVSNSITLSSGDSQSITIEKIDKRINEILSYINDEYFDRIKLGETKGFFKTTAYALTHENAIHERLCRAVMSIFQGDRVSFRPITANILKGCDQASINEESSKTLRDKMLLNFQTLSYSNSGIDRRAATLYSTPLSGSERFAAATYMTVKEVSLIAGIPMKEVPGLALIEGVEFGLNIDKTAGGVKLGNVIYRGGKLEKEEIKIDRNILNKHVFITGVTGSGKTTATQRLLMESRLPFFVIEPAKNEYRELLSRFKELKDEFVIFTPGDETGAPFRFNPFELIQGELITSHIDMLRAAFMSAFTMEAAMPQLIEEALYNIYKNYGWNINSNKNKYCGDVKDQSAPWHSDGIYWPDFSDLIVELKKVVKGHGFGERLEAEYIGSLVSRLNNFTVGGKGAMFNCKNSVNFSELLDKKVIFELEEIKAPEDKALIMGFILTRLIAAVKARYKKNKKSAVSHLIVVEEAHRLLSKYQIGDCAAKKDAVTMFADMLAEVRKYGEGIIIIDQIPNKLESDVLKNTNTKIVHRLFAQDDKEAVGATMAMDDSQKNFLSSLGVGEAVIFSESWNKPVHAMIDMAGDCAQKVSNNDGNESSWESEKAETVEESIKKAGIRQLMDNKEFLFPAFKRASRKLNDGGALIDGAVLKKYGDDINELIIEFNLLCGEIKSKIIAGDLSGPFDIGGANGPLMKKITGFVKIFNKFIAGFDGNDSGNENEIKGARLEKIKETVRLAVNYDIIYKRGPWLFNEHARGLLSDIIITSAKRPVFSEEQSFEELLDCAAEVVGEFIDKILDACKNDGNADSLKALSEFLSAGNECKRRIALNM